VAFFLKKIRSGTVVFWAAVMAEFLVLTVFILTKAEVFKMGFLWLNPIGAFGVILFSLLLNGMKSKKIAPVRDYSND
jgi:SSS family solute:Na+ symporter